MTRVAAVILAGGEARRLGGVDKPLIEIGGMAILSHILSRLRPQVGPIALSANGDPARYGAFGLPVLADRHAGIGPLAGLARGLEWAAEQGAELLLTVPGDTPFVPAGLVQALLPAPAVAVSNGRRHHLVATWPVACAALLARHLAELGPDRPRRDFGVAAFARRLVPREAAFPAEPFDPFLNVNTVDDRCRAEAAGVVLAIEGHRGPERVGPR